MSAHPRIKRSLVQFLAALIVGSNSRPSRIKTPKAARACSRFRQRDFRPSRHEVFNVHVPGFEWEGVRVNYGTIRIGDTYLSFSWVGLWASFPSGRGRVARRQ